MVAMASIHQKITWDSVDSGRGTGFGHALLYAVAFGAGQSGARHLCLGQKGR
jgi:hypothetical protein